MYKIEENYFNSLFSLINFIEVSNEKGKNLDFYKSLEKVVNILINLGNHGYKLIFIGNGASAAISSHMAVDFWKNGGIRALAFNDSSLLTCISNDYGYKHVFEKPIEMFVEPHDILFAISSSGRSKNILRAVKKAKHQRVSKTGIWLF